jgi:acetyl-CoA carboxylase biotin carboxyl carrier protein
MDVALIERLMRMLEQSSLQELDVNDGGTRIRIAKKRTLGLDDGEPAPATVETVVDEPADAGPHRILSGMTGTFYRASAPGVAPYVTEGTRIEDGQKVGLIEAMKVFNPVEADVTGTVLRVLVEDGASVHPGMALFEIEPA